MAANRASIFFILDVLLLIRWQACPREIVQKSRYNVFLNNMVFLHRFNSVIALAKNKNTQQMKANNPPSESLSRSIMKQTCGCHHNECDWPHKFKIIKITDML